MAAGMVAHGEATGALRPGMRVVEYTGGSTGSSLAMVCATSGYGAHLVSADCFATEKIRTMQAFGAEVEVLESDGGKVTPELFDRFKVRIAELAAEPDTWWAEQFVNPGNATACRAFAPEIVDELGDGVDFRDGHGNGRLLLRRGRGAEGTHPCASSRSSLRRRATCRASPSAGTGWRDRRRLPPARRAAAGRGARAGPAGRDDPDRLRPEVPRGRSVRSLIRPTPTAVRRGPQARQW
jgi:hypothetical protein